MLRPFTPEADSAKIETIHACGDTIREMGWPFYVTVGHLGVFFGGWWQLGYSALACKEMTINQCMAWKLNQDIPERNFLVPVGDREVLELMLRDPDPPDVNIVPEDNRPPLSDEGGIIDLGCQYGSRVQDGKSKHQAMREAGDWLVQWYQGENPWKTKVTHLDPIEGQLRYGSGNRCYRDDNGPRNVIGNHMGDLIGQSMGFGLDHVRPALSLVRDSSFNLIRAWVNVPDHPWWRDKPVPTWNPLDNPIRFRETLNAANELGIRWHLASGGIAGMSDQQENEMYDEIAKAISDVGPTAIALFEVCNEIWGTGDSDDKSPQELARLCERVRSKHPQLLYSLSAAAGADENRATIHEYTLPWMQHYYYHAERNHRLHDKIRHGFSMGYSGEHPAVRWLGWSGEPWGNGRLVSITGNKHELDGGGMALGAAMGVMARQAWNQMGGSSVILYDDPVDKEGFYETPALIRDLPKDVAQFPTLSHSGSSQRGRRIWVARDDCRSDYAINNDGRFVAINYGPPEQNPHLLVKERATIEENVVHSHPFGRVIVGRLA